MAASRMASLFDRSICPARRSGPDLDNDLPAVAELVKELPEPGLQMLAERGRPKLFATGNDRHTASCHMVDPASGHSKAGHSSAGELQYA